MLPIDDLQYRVAKKFKDIHGHVYLCKPMCTICLAICYDYPCLYVVSVDVVCIPACTHVLLTFSLHGTVMSMGVIIYSLSMGRPC